MLEIVLIKPNETETVVITPEKMLNNECLVGRDRRCCIVLPDTMVSGAHGKFFYQEGNYYYADFYNTNGSYINNEAVKQNNNYQLKPTDVIQIGPYTLLIQSLGNNVVTESMSLISPNQYMPLAFLDPADLKRWNESDITVRCVQVINETDDVKTFRFVAEPPVLFTYKPGQFVTLDLSINGNQVMPCSISSTPSRPHTLEITVKRILSLDTNSNNLSPGLAYNWLYDNIIIGSEVKLSAPMGEFTCFANPAKKLLLISAGCGITPMISMLRWICDTGSNIDVVLVHSTRSPRDIIFHQELKMMSARHPNFKLVITTTRPEPGQSWLGYTGRINKSMLTNIAPDYDERNIFVCGPISFMSAVQVMCEELQFPMHNYYSEDFCSSHSKLENSPQPQESEPLARFNVAPRTTSKLKIPSGNLEVVMNSADFMAKIPAVTDNFTTNNSQTDNNSNNNSNSSNCSKNIVVFSKSGKEVTCDAEESILESGLASGIELAWGCKAGKCGACEQRLLKGEVNYEQEPKYQCAPDHALLCVAHPVGQVVIDA